MAIVVGDIHGQVEKVERFLAFRPDQLHLALGDYVDSFTEPIERQLRCLDLLTASDAVLLWGNHDLHYLTRAPWRSSGFQAQHADRLREIFDALLERRRLVAAYWVDGWLCTHAGFPSGGNDLLPAEGCHGPDGRVADCLNQHFHAAIVSDEFSPLFNVPVARGGEAPYGGIFWFDPFHEQIPPDPTWKQIFGHTEQRAPVLTPHWVCLDTTNADDIWVFDTTDSTLHNLRTPDELRRLTALRHKARLERLSHGGGGGF